MIKIMNFIYIVLSVYLSFTILLAQSAPESAVVSQLPGFDGTLPSKHYAGDAGSMIPYHKKLIDRGYRALIYSGDLDLCVPFTGSQACTRSFGYKVVDEWRQWQVNGQVAGFIQGYDKNLTFLTISRAYVYIPMKKKNMMHGCCERIEIPPKNNREFR